MSFSKSLRIASRALLCASVALACQTTPEPELSLLYTPAAQHHGIDRNPIIVIPGLLGTKLVDQATGRLVWGAFDVGSGAAARDVGMLALPVRDDVPIDQLGDGLAPDGVLERIRIRLAGIPIEVEAYAQILATLGAGGYRDEALGLGGEVDYGDGHFTCFQFDYDWRLDNVANARRLAAFIREKRAYVQAEYATRFGAADVDVKFDIAAHSMGGLILRWFLRYGEAGFGPAGEAPELSWAGAEFVERAVLIATPNAGSVEAFDELVAGEQLAPLLPIFPAALIGTFPSAYQLLPRARHGHVVWSENAAEGRRAGQPVALFDPELWERMGWGLASPEAAGMVERMSPDGTPPEQRRARAIGLQRRMLENAERFHAALDRPATPPPGLTLMGVAGDATPTVSRLEVDASGKIESVGNAPGDGTVLRSSMLLDERVGGSFEPQLRTGIGWNRVLFLPNDHLGVTSSPTFRDNVLYWLLEEPR